MSVGLPPKQGLYDPALEHDSCGVGFLVHLKGSRSHQIIRSALKALKNLSHRGACGCEANTGDGAGVLIQIPHEFLTEAVRPHGFELPGPGAYGVGCLFQPRSDESRTLGKQLFERIVAEEGQTFLGWRPLPTDNHSLGDSALAVEPLMEHAFVGRAAGSSDPDQFERKLYVIRKRFENAVKSAGLPDADHYYFPSLSCYTLVYKGMLTPEQLEEYFAHDLTDERLVSALCMYHSRFSTNTFPSWELAHPYRVLSHNGEINTKRGNINWMRARQHLLESSLFEEGDVEKLLPIIQNEDGSDTAVLDNVVELLIKSGRSPAHVMMMIIPEAWENHETMSQEKKDFYAYHACFMEPWDGPASVAFTDGKTIGATLDRNGLRPSRYWVTKDDLVIMASEVGVLDIPADQIVKKGRLEPGRMFLVNMEEGRIVGDEELKHSLASAHPYGEWLKEHLTPLESLPETPHVPEPDHETLLTRQIAFGYTVEDQKYILGPMATQGLWGIGSMGTDTPLAVLSDRPQPLYNYFKQLFAQVSNPPLDAIREEVVTSVLTNLGPEANLLDPGPEAAHQISLKNPILDNDEVARLKQLDGHRGFRSIVLPMVFSASEGAAGMERALEGIFRAASEAITNGVSILILSDRSVDARNAPIPSLLACAGLHHHLVREGTRTKIGLVIETGDAREVHHFCLLLGYGAGAINPYVAFESLDDMIHQGLLPEIDHKTAFKNYTKAIYKGVVKVMSKMGISTIQSYRGAQIFEAIGLNESFVDRFFTKTASQVGGIGIEEIARETLVNHHRAYHERVSGPKQLIDGGQYQWRREGEYHLFNPETVFRLQHATRSGRYDVFKTYTQRVNDQSERLCTLRGLFEFKMGARPPVPIEEVESAEEITKKFCTGAMSYGSISAEAHETLAIAMNRLGGWSNTGEGGEDRKRYTPDPNGDSRRSRIKQVASGRFGVTSEYLVSADELQIKMAQGAKPGEGGELPGRKVYPWIAKVRGTTPGVGLISPPPHHDIYSIEDLAQLIYDLKNSNPDARIAVKLVSEIGVGVIAAGVAKAHSDVVLISGHDGGTGASPLASIKHAGTPWELGLAETQQVLVMNKLRDRIVVQTDGQLKTGRDVVIAALLGAEEFGFATAPLVVMGCILMRVCHLDTCPVGVATQRPDLRERFQGKAEHVVNFMLFIAEEVRELMAQLGFRTLQEMVGHSELLDMRRAIEHYKAQGLDFSRIFYKPDMGPDVAIHRVTDQDHGLNGSLDMELLPRVMPALEDGKSIEIDSPIRNVNRTVGTIVGSHLTRKYGFAGMPEDSIRLNFTGSAGQSFGAFLPRGISLMLEGDANDYVGKGLSGGKIVIFPPRNSVFVPEEEILIGNVALYGATGGKAFFRGKAGERFSVRNSGAHTVVEGAGDHCCEYMTGGIVVVLGRTGRNFGAGMSGGTAFVLDEAGDFEIRLNKEMVVLEPFDDPEDQLQVRAMIAEHLQTTRSTIAERVLNDWENMQRKIVKVMPLDYKRVLEEQRRTAESAETNEAQAAAEIDAELPGEVSVEVSNG